MTRVFANCFGNEGASRRSDICLGLRRIHTQPHHDRDCPYLGTEFLVHELWQALSRQTSAKIKDTQIVVNEEVLIMPLWRCSPEVLLRVALLCALH